MGNDDNIEFMTDMNDNPFNDANRTPPAPHPPRPARLTAINDNVNIVGNNTAGMTDNTVNTQVKHEVHPFRTIFSAIADVFIILAIIVGCYFFWLQFWTGVESEQTQTNQSSSMNWNTADTTKIAKKQTGEPPIQPELVNYADMLGELYVPRFGKDWKRNVVEGTDWEQLGRHGIGHYQGSALPGQIGLFAVAGHVNGYGQPLGELDKLQNGDYVIMRTKDYWYVYKQYDQKIINKEQSEAIADVPFQPQAQPTERLMALTTCWPKYYMGPGETPQRRVSYAKFVYWAKVSDGIPQELADDTDAVNTSFTSTVTTGMANNLPDMKTINRNLIIVYAILFIAALAGWQFRGLKAWKHAYDENKTLFSFTGWIYRLQPGTKPVRIMLMALFALVIITAIIGYACPWVAENIPALRVSAAMD